MKGIRDDLIDFRLVGALGGSFQIGRNKPDALAHRVIDLGCGKRAATVKDRQDHVLDILLRIRSKFSLYQRFPYAVADAAAGQICRAVSNSAFARACIPASSHTAA